MVIEIIYVCLAIVPVNECSDNELNDCDANATCNDLTDGFECTCNDGYNGTGEECTQVQGTNLFTFEMFYDYILI